MTHSLGSKTVDLIETQKQIIEETLQVKRKAGIIKSDEEYRAEKERLFHKIDSHQPKPFMKVRNQEGLTDARNFNDTYEELTYDLRTVFEQLNQVDETIHKHQRLNQSLIHNLQLRIKRMKEVLGQEERTYNLQDSHQVYVENFVDSNSLESDMNIYTERNGQKMPLSYRVKLDTEREIIKLPSIISQNTLIGPSGVQLGKLEIMKQLGSGYKRTSNPENELSKAIDNSKETFWSESIQVDEPIRVPMGANYYNLDFGAACEIEVQFDYLTQLNELSFLMFGEYPVDIIAVRYFETDNDEEQPKELISPNQTIKSLQSRSTQDTTSFQFDDIYAKRLRILINQRHYIKTEFIASQRNQRNIELWLEQEEAANTGQIFKPVLDDKKHVKDWRKFHESLKNKTPKVEDILGELEKEHKQAISKYEYNYGIYNLAINRNEYQPTGVYVSKEIPVNGNVKTFSIETDEEHPEPIPNVRVTDIEYYVFDGENWHSILPKNQDKILCERLFPELVNGTYQARTRFEIVSGLTVYKNGEPVTITQLDTRTFTISDYQAAAIYTASYYPNESAREINFLKTNTPRTVVEEFRGTNNKGRVELRHFPYVDKTKLNAQPLNYNPTYLENEANSYLPMKIHLVDKEGYHITQPANSSETGVMIENVTNYFDPDISKLETYDESQGTYYQYRVVNNTIEFNKPLPESTRIVIEYPYLVSHIRTKAILRRNIHRFYGLTPVLYKYIGHFQTLR